MKLIVELFKKFWFKIIVEIVLVFVIWTFYYIAKNLIPKKYRIKESNFKDFLKTISVVLANATKKDDGIVSIVGKSKALFEHFQGLEQTIPNTKKEFQKYIKETKEEISEHTDYHFINLVFTKIEQFGKQEIVHKISDQENIIKFTFDTHGETVNFYAVKILSAHSEEKVYNNYFACKKDFDYHKVTDLLFEITQNKLYLSAKNSEKLVVEKLEMDFNQENYIVDEKIYNELLSEILAFKAKGIQRSYILNGPPGTGKTTFSLELSRKVSGKVLKVDSNTFNNLATGAIKAIIENLSCDFIVVDDIDRIHPSDLPAFLYMLEQIKGFKTKPTLLATVNDISSLDSAAIRPGRFDDIIEFDYPNLNERVNFFRQYCKKLNVEISEKEIEILAEVTEGMTQAYLKEYCFQFSIEGDAEKVAFKIKKRKKYLDHLKNNIDESTVKETIQESMEFDKEVNENSISKARSLSMSATPVDCNYDDD